MLNPENEVKTNHMHTAVKYPHKHTERLQGGLPWLGQWALAEPTRNLLRK
jgi:hypothetical protein